MIRLIRLTFNSTEAKAQHRAQPTKETVCSFVCSQSSALHACNSHHNFTFQLFLSESNRNRLPTENKDKQATMSGRATKATTSRMSAPPLTSTAGSSGRASRSTAAATASTQDAPTVTTRPASASTAPNSISLVNHDRILELATREKDAEILRLKDELARAHSEVAKWKAKAQKKQTGSVSRRTGGRMSVPAIGRSAANNDDNNDDDEEKEEDNGSDNEDDDSDYEAPQSARSSGRARRKSAAKGAKKLAKLSREEAAEQEAKEAQRKERKRELQRKRMADLKEKMKDRPELTLAGKKRKRKGFDNYYNQLKAFHDEHGHVHVTPKMDKHLSSWMSDMRTQYRYLQEGKKSFMTTQRIAKLTNLGFQWKLREEKPTPWDLRFAQLAEYKARHGHCNIAQFCKLPTTPKGLGNWAHEQRRSYKKAKRPARLTPDRIEAMESIGFKWKLRTRGKGKGAKSEDGAESADDGPSGAAAAAMPPLVAPASTVAAEALKRAVDSDDDDDVYHDAAQSAVPHGEDMHAAEIMEMMYAT